MPHAEMPAPEPLQLASGQDKYWYVSHTPQGLVHPVDRLIRAASDWEPCAGRIIDAFDFGWLSSACAPALPLPDLPPRSSDPADIAQAVFDILNLSEYRRGPAEHLAGVRDHLLPQVVGRIKAGQPVRIVIPSFPGRPYNPITHQRVAPDLGEAFAFVLLDRISRHVATVYPPGIQFIICLDGTVYNPFYGYTNEADHQYPVDLQRFIDSLGAQDAIAIIDLQDLIDERHDEFLVLRREARRELTEDWGKEDYKFRDDLIETMKMGTNTVALNAAAVYLIKYLDPKHDVAELVTRMRAAVGGRARHTAFEYMAFLATIRRMKLIEAAFPDAIRGTVHPKPGQYSPYLVSKSTEIAPWHGVAVLRTDGSIDTVYESEIFADPRRYIAIYIRGDYTPFYYEENEDPAGAPDEGL